VFTTGIITIERSKQGEVRRQLAAVQRFVQKAGDPWGSGSVCLSFPAP